MFQGPEEHSTFEVCEGLIFRLLSDNQLIVHRFRMPTYRSENPLATFADGVSDTRQRHLIHTYTHTTPGPWSVFICTDARSRHIQCDLT